MTTLESLSVNLVDKKPEAFEEARKIFDKNGALIAKGFLSNRELEPIRRYIAHLVALRRQAVGLGPVHCRDFDDGFLEMAKRKREDVGPIYDACRRIMPVHQLSDSVKIAALSQFLMRTRYLISYREKQVRVDLPTEKKFLFDWHQDFHYAQDSEDALVYWIPLHRITPENGALTVALGSHKLGVQNVRFIRNYGKDPKKSRSHSIEICDLSVLERFEQISLSMEAGDVLVFNTLLLHKSGNNESNRTRWTVQIRHGNFDNDRAVAKGWPGAVIDGFPLHKFHPEYVVNLSEIEK